MSRAISRLEQQPPLIRTIVVDLDQLDVRDLPNHGHSQASCHAGKMHGATRVVFQQKNIAAISVAQTEIRQAIRQFP